MMAQDADGYFYRVWLGASGRYVAECKRTPFEFPKARYQDMLRETGDIWFEFGATEAEALARLKASERA